MCRIQIFTDSLGPDMLHVVFASDENQVEGAHCSNGGRVSLPGLPALLMKGVQASVASVVSATASPDELTIHIIVQARSLNTFKDMGSWFETIGKVKSDSSKS